MMGSVTHELKTPLMSISHFVDIAKQETNEKKKNYYLSFVETNCELLRYLINVSLLVILK